jgi:hypothetical protein
MLRMTIAFAGTIIPHYLGIAFKAILPYVRISDSLISLPHLMLTPIGRQTVRVTPLETTVPCPPFRKWHEERFIRAVPWYGSRPL